MYDVNLGQHVCYGSLIRSNWSDTCRPFILRETSICCCLFCAGNRYPV